MTSESSTLNITTFSTNSNNNNNNIKNNNNRATISSVMETHRILSPAPSSSNNPNVSIQNHPSQNQSQSNSNPQHQSSQLISSTPLQSQSSSQEFCLRWNNYQTNLTCVFDQLLQSESFVDVTLACDGHSIKAHKMVLSACSPYFQMLFFDNPCQHPIIIMRDVKWPELKAIVEFMYKGEINVNQDQIGPLLRVAEMLKIRGLADVNQDQDLSSPIDPHSIITNLTATPSITSNNNNNNVDNHNKNKNNSSTHSSNKKSSISAREWADVENMEANVGGASSTQANPLRSQRKRKWHSTENNSSHESPHGGHETPEHMEINSPLASHPSTTPIPPPSHIQTPSTPTPMSNFSIPPPLESLGLSTMSHPDDMEIKPGIAEMIREEERAKLMENSHPWLGASTSSLAVPHDQNRLLSPLHLSNQHHHNQADYSFLLKLKTPTWTQIQLRDAINAVVTQKMRFTQAATRYNIPKGTLYDNILGKSNRMQVLEDAGLDLLEENAILEFCCDVSMSPYNRRTKKSLSSILEFVQKLKFSNNNSNVNEEQFDFRGKSGFRWWWAFCKKYSIVSLHYENNTNLRTHD